MKFKRALVTGGAGFIGSHLVDELMRRGCEVAVIDNLRKGKIANIDHHYSQSAFIFEKCGIESNATKNVFRIFRPQVVFHLAAIPSVPFSMAEPISTNETNVHGTVNLLELSRQFNVDRFIFSSSSSVYGGAGKMPTSESEALNPLSPYALQKKISEEYCQFYAEHLGLDTVSLRYFNVFGPRQMGDSPYSSVISAFLDCKKRKGKAKIYGNGKQYRDFCHVDNVVNANILAANHEGELCGDIYNVGCGEKHTVNEIYKRVKPPGSEHLETREGDVFGSCADIKKIKADLGYDIKVGFEEGLDRTISWYMSLE